MLRTSKAKLGKVRRIGQSATGFIFVRSENKYQNILLADICYLEARGNWCMLVTSERKYMVLARLKDFVETLPAQHFCQIHRAFIVNLAHLISFDNKYVYLTDNKLTIGEVYKSILLNVAPILHAIKGKKNRLEGQEEPA